MEDHLQMARDMVSSGFHDEARKIIRTTEHSDTGHWLEQIDKVEQNEHFQGKLFSGDEIILIKRDIASIDTNLPHPWLILDGGEKASPFSWLTLYTGFLYFSIIATIFKVFWAIIIKPYPLILLWRRYKRPKLAIVYGIFYCFILIGLISTITILINGFASDWSILIFGVSMVAFIAFPFTIISHQTRIYNQLTGNTPIKSRFLSGCILILILVFGFLLFFFAPVLFPEA